MSKGKLQLAYRKLITVEEAASKIHSNDTLVVSGFVAQNCPDRLLEALASRFKETGRPKDLTLLFGGGPGDYDSRGLNRLALPGMLKRCIGGHYGQVPKIANMVLNNEIPAFALPLGGISKMIRSAASHTPDYLSKVGLGTFVDPRVRGGRLNDLAASEEYVSLTTINGSEYLRYKSIPIRVALIQASTADTDGNLSMERESTLGDSRIMATAARASGGVVIAQVGRIAKASSLKSRETHIPSSLVDFICHVPEQTMSFFVDYDPAATGEIRIPPSTDFKQNRTSAKNGDVKGMKGKTDERIIIARRAAKELNLGDIVNLGIGMPEGLAEVVGQENCGKMITLTTEAGIVGGEMVSG